MAKILAANKPTDRELGKLLGRTVRAIQIKRAKLRAVAIKEKEIEPDG